MTFLRLPLLEQEARIAKSRERGGAFKDREEWPLLVCECGAREREALSRLAAGLHVECPKECGAVEPMTLRL